MENQPKIKYCHWQKGTLYWSVRNEGAPGKCYIPLPNPLTEKAQFERQYEDLRFRHERRKNAKLATQAAEREGKRTARSNIISNSFKALVAEAEKTRAYKEMAPRTRIEADRYYAMFVDEWGDRLVADLTSAEVDRRMDKPDMLDFPGKAFNYLKHLKGLIELGLRRGYRADNFNPARGADVPQGGEREPWPDDVYEAVVERSTDMLRLAVLLGVYTGQRISDCIRIDREELLECGRSGEPMMLVQMKTGVEVYIPIHPDLVKAVEAVPASETCGTVLYNRVGRPFPDPGQIQNRLRLLMLELGHSRKVTKAGEEKVETLYKFHGLRKLSSCHLVEAGATPHEVSAINGMDIQTVIHYTRKVAKKKLSRGFQDRMNTIRPGQERPDLRLVA